MRGLMISENLNFVVLSGLLLVMNLLLLCLVLKVTGLRRDLDTLYCTVQVLTHPLPPPKKDPTDA